MQVKNKRNLAFIVVGVLLVVAIIVTVIVVVQNNSRQDQLNADLEETTDAETMGKTIRFSNWELLEQVVGNANVDAVTELVSDLVLDPAETANNTEENRVYDTEINSTSFYKQENGDGSKINFEITVSDGRIYKTQIWWQLFYYCLAIERTVPSQNRVTAELVFLEPENSTRTRVNENGDVINYQIENYNHDDVIRQTIATLKNLYNGGTEIIFSVVENS